MNYSARIKEVEKKAIEMASRLNSTQAGIPHVIAGAMSLAYVEEALDDAGVDAVRVKNALETEANEQPKVSERTAKRYRDSNIERKISLSMEANYLLRQANTIAETGGWKTGEVEISHIIMAVSQAMTCQTLNKYLGLDREDVRLANKFVNNLITAESSITGTPPVTVELESTGQLATAGNARNDRKEVEVNQFCTDLLAQAKKDNKPFVGRKNEITALMQCLERKDKPNAILAGAPGVGKTDIVRGLAKRIVGGDVPEQLKDVNLLLIDIPGMLAGSEYRGTFEKRLKGTIEEAVKMERPILFIDEIHTVLGAGQTSGSSMDAANILKPYLTDGRIRVIGATTADEYRKYVESDAAFMRRFQKIDVSEPSPKEAVEILNGVKPAYEDFHKVKINADAIKASVDLSVRYMHDRFLPDKAIDIIDQTCARVKIEQGKKVTLADIENTVSELCHVPASTVQKDEMAKVKILDKKLKEQVFGQDEAIDSLVEAIQMSKAGLNDETKPIGSFLFVGPSGVGKTEVSKQLAANLGIEFIRFDMSEYGEAHSVAKLIGSPAGYVGYDDGGVLVEAVRQKPHAVVLFDEIEKAHPDIYKIFLQIFDYGMLTDNKGRKADFRNTVIIMTSNAGNAAAEKGVLGFNGGLSDRKEVSMDAIKNLMAPELRGRISSIVVFNKLSNEVSKMIVVKELNKLSDKLKSKGTVVTFTDATIQRIMETGVSAQYGAREIQRTIDNDIKKMFVKQIISGKGKGEFIVDVVDGKYVINNVASEKPVVGVSKNK